MTKSNLPEPGDTVSHYRVLNQIAGGGMGVVYRAEDVKLGRAVALKFLPEEAGDDEVALARFEREARTASSLNHANICTIYEVEEHEGTPFIVMEYLDGQTLRDLVALASIASSPGKTRKPPMSVEEIVSMGMQIAEGLDSAHQRGIIHRDIKPANIFLTRERQVKILDFGLAKLIATAHDDAGDQLARDHVSSPQTQLGADRDAERSLTRAGASLGTTGYMSPEQVEGVKLDARTDIFCLGLVLYEAATGRRAFGGASKESYRQSVLRDAVVPVHELNPAIPAALEGIIHRCLEKDRKQRYQQASDVRKELKPIQRELSAVVSRALVAERLARAVQRQPQANQVPVTKPPIAQPPKKRILPTMIIAIALALAIGIVILLLRPHGA